MVEPIERTNDFRITEAVELLKRNVQIFQSSVLNSAENLLYKSALLELVINCYELSKILEAFDRRILAAHDLQNGEASVAELIGKFRHAFVHTSTTHAKFADEKMNRITVQMIRGFHPTAIVLDGKEIGSHHGDDVAYVSGASVLYQTRHLFFVHNTAHHWLNKNIHDASNGAFINDVLTGLVEIEIRAHAD